MMLSSLWLTRVLMSGGFQYSILFSVEISRGMCPSPYNYWGTKEWGTYLAYKLWGNKRRGTDTCCEVITLVNYYFTSQVKEDQKDWLSNKLQTLLSFFSLLRFFPYFFQMSMVWWIPPFILMSQFVTILFLYLFIFSFNFFPLSFFPFCILFLQVNIILNSFSFRWKKNQKTRNKKNQKHKTLQNSRMDVT